MLLSRLPPPMFAPVAEALGFPHWQEISEAMQAQQAEQEAMQQAMMQQEALANSASPNMESGTPAGEPAGSMQAPAAPDMASLSPEEQMSDEEMAAAMQMLAEKGEL